MISAQDPAALAARDAQLREAIERHGGDRPWSATQAGAALPGGARALRLRRRLRPAVDRGQRRRPAAGPGRAAQGRRLAADPRRRVHPRLPRRGGRDPRRAGARPARRQRLLPRLPQAAPGRRGLPPHARRRRRATTRAARSCWRPSSSGAGATARRSTSPPTAPTPPWSPTPARNNAFSYLDDQDGLRCPVGSHIRRANPRHGLPFEGKLVNRHRLIRRGIPYGDPLPAGRRGRRPGPRRRLHVPAGEHRAPVRVRAGAVVQRRQRAAPRRRRGRADRAATTARRRAR